MGKAGGREQPDEIAFVDLRLWDCTVENFVVRDFQRAYVATHWISAFLGAFFMEAWVLAEVEFSLVVELYEQVVA